jgi:hypothetical protein
MTARSSIPKSAAATDQDELALHRKTTRPPGDFSHPTPGDNTMRTQAKIFPRLLATAAALAIGAALPLGAMAGGAGAGVAAQTNMLDTPFYLQAGSLAMSVTGTVQRDSGREVAEKSGALDTPFYLLPDTTPVTAGSRSQADGRDIASSTSALEIPPYLRPRL